MRPVLTMGILIMCVLTAQARVGEHMYQLEARFGKGKKKELASWELNTGDIYIFTDGPVTITAWFIQGICHRIQYKFPKAITDEQAKALLRANLAISASWIRDPSARERWYSDDRRLKAERNYKDVTIFTPTWAAIEKRAKAEPKKPKPKPTPSPVDLRKY